MHMTFLPTLDGEWIKIPNTRRITISCCSCGLVHKLVFKVVKGQIHFKATRDLKETRKLRRNMKRK